MQYPIWLTIVCTAEYIYRQLEEPSRGAQNKRGSLNGDNNEHPPASSMFGFMFGSSSSSTMEKRGSAAGLEMDSFRASQVNPLMKVIDLSKERLPTGKCRMTSYVWP